MTVNSEFQYVQAAAVISRCDESAMLWADCSTNRAREALLEVDDAEPVQECLRLVAVRQAADGHIAEIEPDPDEDLESEMPPTAWKDAAAGCDDSGHDEILVGRGEGKKEHCSPPM